MTAKQLAYAIVFCGALLLFTFNLASNEILMIDTRFALFTDEMLKNGIGPFPQLYGQYYPDYTSVPIILMAAFSLLLGETSQLSIAFPSAIAAAAMLAVTCRTGTEFRSLHFGILAVLLSLLSVEFLNICRIASIDLFPALAAAISFFLTWRALDQEKKMPWAGILLCMFAGYLARGPVGVMIPLAAAAAPCIAQRRFKLFARLLAAALLLCGLPAILWLVWAYQAAGREFVDSVIKMQFASRFGSGKPLWYYFTNAAGSYAVVYPVGLLTAAVYLWHYRKQLRRPPVSRHETMVLSLILWMLFILLGMSLPGTKHLRYVVGVIPPAALLMALLLENPDRIPLFDRIGKLFFLLAKIIPAAVLAGFAALQILRIDAVAGVLRMNIPFDYSFPAVAAPVPVLVLLLNRIKFTPPVRRLFLTGGAALSVLALHTGILEGMNQARQSSAAFVAAVEKFRPAETPLWFACLGPDGDENKYLWNVPAKQRFIPRYLCKEPLLDEKEEPLLDENSQMIFELKYRNPAGEELPPPQSGDLVLVRLDKWIVEYDEAFRAAYEPLLTGRLAHRNAALLRKK